MVYIVNKKCWQTVYNVPQSSQKIHRFTRRLQDTTKLLGLAWCMNVLTHQLLLALKFLGFVQQNHTALIIKILRFKSQLMISYSHLEYGLNIACFLLLQFLNTPTSSPVTPLPSIYSSGYRQQNISLKSGLVFSLLSFPPLDLSLVMSN